MRGWNLRWLIGGLALLIALGGGHALAQGPGGTQPIVPGSPPEEAEDRRQRLLGSLRTSEAREARLRSREAFKALAPTEAVELARREFAPETRGPVFRAVRPGERIVETLGRSGAVVEHADGTRGILRSTTEVAVGDRAVDLTLAEQPDGDFAPVTSATPVEIGGTAPEGLTMGDEQIGVTLAGAEPVAGVLRDDRVFWAGAATDSDYFVTPVPGGVETFLQLRSGASPERHTLELDLPAGAVVRRARTDNPIPGDPPRAMEIVADGKPAAFVYPPLSYDADGTAVPTDFTVDTEGIHLDVAHRDGDFRYPLLVDPTIIARGESHNGWPGWIHYDNIPDDQQSLSHQIGAHRDDPAYGPYGLYLSLPTNNHYGGWEGGTWIYRAPVDLNVYRATFGNIAHDSKGWSRAWQGLQDYAGAAWQQPVSSNNWSTPPQYAGNPIENLGSYSGVVHDFCFFDPRCTKLSDHDQNMAVFGLGLTRAASTGSQLTTATMTWANVFLGDRYAPTIQSGPGDRLQWRNDGAATHAMSLAAADQGAGVASATLSGAASGNGTIGTGCTGGNNPPIPCATTHTFGGFAYTLREGVNVLSAQVRDVTDNASAVHRWTEKVDRTPPNAPTLGGTLYTGRATPVRSTTGTLTIGGTDSTANATTNSGVSKVDVKWDGTAVATTSCSGGDNCSVPATTYSLAQLTAGVGSRSADGTHSVEVVVTDRVGLTRSTQWNLTLQSPSHARDDRLGLERFFGYESFATGAGSAAHVNVDNRNVVWHSVPITNPGRGLATVVNLTYNSRDDGGYIGSLIKDGATPVGNTTIHGLAGDAYGEAGIGFSLGISGLTRLNEPLTGLVDAKNVVVADPPSVRLTDADGTRHTFTRDVSRPGWYHQPAGVNVTLRKTGDTRPERTWIATRADGTAFYFDAHGYQTYIRDRNGNEIRFEYERYSKVMGGASAECQAANPPIELLCSPRVVRVVDAAGVAAEPVMPTPGSPRHPAVERRSLLIQYYDKPLLSADAANDPLSPGFIGPVGGTAGRIKRIIDHGGRVTDFSYNGGYLNALHQGEVLAGPGRQASVADRRTFIFNYTELAQGYSQLAYVTDPRGGVSQFAYEAAQTATAPIQSHTTRRFGVTTFALEGGRTCVTAPGARVTCHTVDSLGRPVRFDDAVGASDLMTWDTDNNLERIERGSVGTTPGAVTTIAYERLGNPVSVTDPRQNVTTYSYVYGDETGLAPHGGDDGSWSVADLERIDRPGANDLAIHLNPTNGNVTGEQLSGYPSTRREYDVYGQVTLEYDEQNRQTGYEDYDENGLPQLGIDPRGKHGDPDTTGRWLYRYDAVGNVLHITDPRGTNPALEQPFTTSFTYDAFDRVLTETHPKRSNPAPGEAAEWIHRTHTYDRNGNQLTTTDGNGEQSRWTYTYMDQVQESISPPTTHADETAAASEVTRLEYDLRENLIEETSPKGTQTPTVDDDFATQYAYDLDDRVETVRRMSRAPGDTPVDLLTAYAYDSRDNVVRVADPRTNATGEWATNLQTRPRLSVTYDLADNATDVIEGQGAAARHTRHAYDALNRVSSTIAAKGMAGGAPTSDAANYTTTTTYDSRNQPLEEDHRGRVSRHEYYGDGQLRNVVSPRGVTTTGVSGDFTTSYAYNPNGELESIELPRHQDQYGPQLKISYERNAVGDPVRIIDPRNNARDVANRVPIRNEFFDTGHLRTTTRPGHWAFRAGGGQEIQELPYEQWRTFQGGDGQLPATVGQGDFGAVGQQNGADIMPPAGLTTFFYDNEMRLNGVRDVAGNSTWMARDPMGRITCTERPFDGNGPGTGVSVCDDPSLPATRDRADIVTRRSFDHNGNLRRATDALAYATTTDYDQFDRWTMRTMPGSADEADQVADEAGYGADVVRATWDANGNQATAIDAEGNQSSMTYTGFDELSSVTDPEGGVTTYAYDAHGNRSCELRPRGNIGAVNPCAAGKYATIWTHNRTDEVARVDREVGVDGGTGTELLQTFHEYDANGNRVRTEAPGARPAAGGDPNTLITRRTFDGRDLPWATTNGTGTTASATVREYDPNGNLRRVVNPEGVAADGLPRTGGGTSMGAPQSDAGIDANVFVTNDDGLLTAQWLPQDSAGAAHYRQQYERGERGQLLWIEAPHTLDADRTVRLSYTYFRNFWIEKSTDEHWIKPTNETRTRDFAFEYSYDRRGSQIGSGLIKPEESDAELRLTERQYYPSGALKRRIGRRTPSDTTPRSYTYGYDSDRQLRQTRDVQRNRNWNMRYDEAGRLETVNEAWAEGKDTRFDYNRDGDVIKRWTDGRISGTDYVGGKAAEFSFDSLGRETVMRVQRSGQSSDRTTRTSYWPSSRRQERTKPNGTVERWYFDGQDRLNSRVRDPHMGTTEEQAYEYDLNGNRVRDERGTHEYNARDQVTQWTRANGSSVTYGHNGSGALVRKSDGGQYFNYEMHGDRLQSVRVDQHGASATRYFAYDRAGNMTCAGSTSSTGCVDATQFRFDEFNRLLSTTGRNGKVKSYVYDGLDRRDFRCEGGTGLACTGGKSRNLSYVGLSNELSAEQDNDGVRREYDYDASMQRVGFERIESNGTGNYRAFAQDANGSVVGIEGGSGELACGDRYAYDPYGESVAASGCEGTFPSRDATDNPFRFEGFAYDADAGSYDMHAREYVPDIGRFASLDLFESSTGDLTLQMDPLTQHRYAFAAGNPVNLVEFDGHYAGNEGGAQQIMNHGGTNTPEGRGQTRETPQQTRARHTTTTEAQQMVAERNTDEAFPDPVEATPDRMVVPSAEEAVVGGADAVVDTAENVVDLAASEVELAADGVASEVTSSVRNVVDSVETLGRANACDTSPIHNDCPTEGERLRAGATVLSLPLTRGRGVATGQAAKEGPAVYRTARRGDGDDELARGLDPARHAGQDRSAYVGSRSVADDFADPRIEPYEDFKARFDMLPEFADEFAPFRSRYDGGGADRFQYAIPQDRIGRFNELTRSRTRVPYGGD